MTDVRSAKKISEVLRGAAQVVERQGGYGCWAIGYVANFSWVLDYHPALDYFRDLFNPTCDKWPFWFGDCRDKKCQAHRILSLCLAASIAESEGL